MKRKWFFVHRNADAGGSGGGGSTNPGPSLADIMNGGTGGNKTPDLADEIAKQTDGKDKPDDTDTGDDPDDDVDPNKDKTGDQADDKDKDKDKDQTDDQTDDQVDEDFYEAVSKITGEKIEVAYPEGIAADSPEAREWLTTPEGTAAVLRATKEKAAEEFEQYLKETKPRAYAFMLHLERGGTEEDFFQDNRGFQLPDVEALKGSADAQAALYKYDLMARGLDDDAAQVLVDKAIKDNKLLDRSLAAHKQIEDAQKKQLADLEAETDAEEKKFTDDLKAFNTNLQKQIKEGLGFIVPDTEQAAFQKYVTDNLRYDNGKFFLVQEVGEDPKTLVESLFFQYKKGDLSKLVAKKAQTIAAQRLRLKTDTGSKTPGNGGGTSSSGSKHLPLSAILPK